MSKKKKKEVEEVKPLIITGAAIQDDFCNYEYEIKTGVGIGDVHKVKGSGVMYGDLGDAFKKFNVHLACIDDVFKHSEVEIEAIDALHNSELTYLYNVTGFKIKGSGENESITLTGTKTISQAGERMSISTPKIELSSLSSYRWHNELKEASDNARAEVEQYKDGKCMPVEETQAVDANQMTIADAIDFEKGKV